MSAVGLVESRDGTVIGFEVHGNGPPMVLVHGTSLDRECWQHVVPWLAERFTVHVLDRRGRGFSTAEREPYAIEREGEDIAAVVEAVGREVYLVAHSYGAVCSLEAALVTDAIGRMVLYEPPVPTPGHPVASPQTRARLRAGTVVGDRGKVLETFLREVAERPAAEVDALKSARAWQDRLAASGLTIAREMDALAGLEPADRLAKIDLPVRLLIGTESAAYYRPAASTVAGAIPDANIVALHGQGHLAIETNPPQFAAAILDFAT